MKEHTFTDIQRALLPGSRHDTDMRGHSSQNSVRGPFHRHTAPQQHFMVQVSLSTCLASSGPWIQSQGTLHCTEHDPRHLRLPSPLPSNKAMCLLAFPWLNVGAGMQPLVGALQVYSTKTKNVRPYNSSHHTNDNYKNHLFETSNICCCCRVKHSFTNKSFWFGGYSQWCIGITPVSVLNSDQVICTTLDARDTTSTHKNSSWTLYHISNPIH